MSSSRYLFSLSLNLIILSIVTIPSHGMPPQPSCSNDFNFDFMLLALQWPQSFCETTSCVAHEDVWSIHGSWPQLTNGKWPQSCCFETEFQSSQISSIRSQLTQHWKTLKSGGTNDEFWGHEWTRHGTCAKNAPLLKGELNYFKNTLKAFNSLSIDEWLSDADITPSDSRTYTVSQIQSALRKGLGYKAGVECLTTKSNGAPILAQINVCLNKETLEPFDCPNNLMDYKCGTHVAYIPSN